MPLFVLSESRGLSPYHDRIARRMLGEIAFEHPALEVAGARETNEKTVPALYETLQSDI